MGYGDIPDIDPFDDSVFVTRQSDIKRKCPAEILYRDHEGYNFVPSEPITIGTTAHAGIEEMLMAETDNELEHALEKWSVLPYVEQQVLDTMRNDGVDDPMSVIGSKWQLRSTAEEVSLAVREWHRTLYPWFKQQNVIAIEQRMRRLLGTSPNTGRPIGVEGTPDLVVWRAIDDWKTSKKDWDPSRATGEIQSPLYTWLASDMLEGVDIPFNYRVWDRGKAKWATHTVHVDEMQVEAAKRIAWQFALAHEAGALVAQPADSTFGKVKRGWWCSPKYCPAWEVCEYKGLVLDGVDLDTSIPVTWAA